MPFSLGNIRARSHFLVSIYTVMECNGNKTQCHEIEIIDFTRKYKCLGGFSYLYIYSSGMKRICRVLENVLWKSTNPYFL